MHAKIMFFCCCVGLPLIAFGHIWFAYAVHNYGN